GQLSIVPGFSWRKASYTQILGGVARVTPPTITWGPGYASLSQGNPSSNGAAVGVVDFGNALPSFALPGSADWGGACILGNDKPTVSTQVAETYIAQKNRLLSSGALASNSCLAFFSDPLRAPYYSLLSTGIDQQQAFDGPRSTVNRYDAGVMG